jgi:8-oxo-dGTP pyrophosphatase MutT (NUDIX family)
MRGAKGLARPGLSAEPARPAGGVEGGSDAAAAALREAVEELRAIREILARRQPS